MGNTPLHLAAMWGFVEIIETLLEYGVKIDRINRLGHTASDYAHNSFVAELLQHTMRITFSGWISKNMLLTDRVIHCARATYAQQGMWIRT